MNCDHVLDHAQGWFDGTIEASDREALSRHLDGCADCRGLIEALVAEPPDDPGLLASILERTSGSACVSARDTLCPYADGELSPLDRSLVEGHLACCPGCATLARILGAVVAELPQLAEADPGEAFVAAVLARTSLRPRAAPLFARWTDAMRRLLDRPRIALEGAFVAAMAVVLPMNAHRTPAAAPGESLRQACRATSAEVLVGAHATWAGVASLVTEHGAVVSSALARGPMEALETLRWREGTDAPAGASRQESIGIGEAVKPPVKDQEKRR